MPSSPGFFDRHYFLLRRLHSLSGVVPIGAFLFPHLITNSSIVWGNLTSDGGVRAFQHEVNFIHSLPALIIIEVLLLWLPIAFHALFGLYIAMSGRPNIDRYRYQDNWRYVLQRLTGYIGIVYIFYHVATLRWGWTWLPLAGAFEPRAAASSTAVALRGGIDDLTWRAFLVSGLYLVCVLALIFHFANGLWTAAITWGLTVSVQAQRRWGQVCAALGLALAAAGVASVVGFVRLDINQARQIEQNMHKGEPVLGETTSAD
jgi:succinate dehydrogenase / fumarate reductase cytochrome b subunit